MCVCVSVIAWAHARLGGIQEFLLILDGLEAHVDIFPFRTVASTANTCATFHVPSRKPVAGST